ncbi:UDP-N-acetylglucosamine 2-epimerase, partial [Pseudomonadota bacterium]
AGMQLQLVVSGAHLSPDQGETCKQIEADGFTIDAKVPMDLDDDSGLGLARAMGQELAGVAEALDALKSDILVVLGDRYETFIAATAAMMLRIPIAHIHGGEVTEGAIDDAMRHAISKMAHLHFTAAELYRQRVIQMGENPGQVFNVGAPGLEAIKRTALLNREGLALDLGFSLDGTVFVITYHPETLGERDPVADVDKLLQALDRFLDARLIITKANADIHGRAINARLEDYAAQRQGRVYLTASLGQLRYYSAVSIADAVIGNSSSGIIEAPTLGTPTVNIGDRQKGRLSGSSVLHCDVSANDIAQTIAQALSHDVQDLARTSESLYGGGNTSAKIVSVLKKQNYDFLLEKSFYDCAN